MNNCFTRSLATDVNQSCIVETPDYNANGFLVRLADVSARDTDNPQINGQIINVYHPSDKPYQTKKVEGKRFNYGFHYTTSIDLVILGVNALTSEQLDGLQKDAWVLYVQAYNSDYPQIIGLENGLRLTSSKQDLGNIETHGAVEVTMTETAAMDVAKDYTEGFLFKQGYEYITGLSIPQDGVLDFSISSPSNKEAYLRMPNGTIASTTAGAYSSTWGGDLGSVILAIPKDCTSLNIGDSGYIGLLSTSISCSFYAINSNITSIYADNLVDDIELQNSNIDLASIERILNNLTTKSITNAYLDFSGYDNPQWIDLSATAQSQLASLVSAGNTIVYSDYIKITTLGVSQSGTIRLSAPNAANDPSRILLADGTDMEGVSIANTTYTGGAQAATVWIPRLTNGTLSMFNSVWTGDFSKAKLFPNVTTLNLYEQQGIAKFTALELSSAVLSIQINNARSTSDASKFRINSAVNATTASLGGHNFTTAIDITGMTKITNISIKFVPNISSATKDSIIHKLLSCPNGGTLTFTNSDPHPNELAADYITLTTTKGWTVNYI